MVTLEELEEEKRNEQTMQDYEIMLHRQIEMQKRAYYESIKPFVKALADIEARRPKSFFIKEASE